jgi:hypothetical protein
MRLLYGLLALLAACASSPTTYERGTLTRPPPPPTRPGVGAPVVGQPGLVTQPPPRSPNTRVLPPSNEPGLWSADTPKAALTPAPEGSPVGPDWLPPVSSDTTERRPECRPVPVPHRGGNDDHNKCADRIKNNSFPGWDVLINSKQFDALVLATRTLWEVKTDDFDIHSPRSQEFFAKVKLPEIRREAKLAAECGYDFVVGVKSAVHKAALLRLAPNLNIVVMDWC